MRLRFRLVAFVTLNLSSPLRLDTLSAAPSHCRIVRHPRRIAGAIAVCALFAVNLFADSTPDGTMMNGVIRVTGGPTISTTTAVSSSANPTVSGQSVTFTASVMASSGSETPSGSVTFNDGSAPICSSVPLANGSTTCTTSSLSIGGHSITARYSGNHTLQGSTSAPISQTVNGLPAPGNLSATAIGTTVALSWEAVSGATSYEIVRSAFDGPYSSVDATAATSYNDAGLFANRTYLYKVRARCGGGVPSPYGAIDPATTVTFTDPSLSSVRVKAVHITELRTAANAMRAAAGLPAATFYDGTLAAGITVRDIHIRELRMALDAARADLFLPAISYTDPWITAGTTSIRQAHVYDLRNGVR